ncbi:hypothetical protein [Microbacterium telephonicum]|uniref:L,D-transpeptidase-like protein n=1 Tax=Microbacterium telephonicum TaxID=1714841 RepID=A0A498C2Q8_9MICO|nr:hypothetical protein [Microbacterium telephonicum]RLK49702.1 hypothetical protein C7474_1863 [Microbacterium telephonicum]
MPSRLALATAGVACALAIAAVAIAASVAVTAQTSPTLTPVPTASVVETMPTAVPTPTPDPIRGAPENVAAYDLAALPQIDVWSVTPGIPVDDDPMGGFTGLLAQPRTAAPIFADPAGEPLGYLPREATYGGTVVPVITRDTHWVKVLLAGRQGVPPNGNAAQTVGWLRVADVYLTQATQSVEVSLSARTIDIVSAGGAERVANDFAWGKDATPTPAGRTFVMLTQVVPEHEYTEGHPLVYLGVQSPTLAGFDGGEVAVTAFHYYKTRSGNNSFGCIYLDSAAITRLATLPPGTPVTIRP